MNGHRIRALLALGLLVLALPARAEEPPLVINTAAEAPHFKGDGTGHHGRMLNELFGRVGRAFELVGVPAERALINLNRGIDDGNMVRIEGLSARYPDIRRVPEPIIHFEFVAFTTRDDVTIDGWDSLKPYDVGIITGWKILEDNATPARHLIPVTDPEQLFTLLARDRADLVIYEKWLGVHLARQMGLETARPLAPPLAERDMYLYLHRKHADLIPRLAEALRAMKADGTYQRITRETLRTPPRDESGR